MKSPKEIAQAHDLLTALVSGHWPIHFRKQDLRMLEAQLHVLCWVQDCEGNDCFSGSMKSLKALIGHIRLHEEGRKYKSQALAE